LLTDLQTPI